MIEQNFPALRALVADNVAAQAELATLLEASTNVSDLQARLTKLEAELAQFKTNSQNSSKSPASDRFTRNKPKPRSLREKTGRKPGGQPGHLGQSLAMSPSPDEIINHPPPALCPECNSDLSEAAAAVDEKGQPIVEIRQVIDLVPPKKRITEHRARTVICPHCAARVSGGFPPGVHGPVCYGPSVQATVLYLSVEQLLPSHRLVDLMEELCDCPMSPGSVATIVRRGGEAAAPIVAAIRAEMKQEPWCGFDETGLSLAGNIHWLHTASSPNYTVLHAHANRGKIGILAGGIIEGYTGIAIHDYWSAYHDMTERHGLCNAHHLRELRYLFEEMEQPWAGRMMTFLRTAKKQVETATDAKMKLEPTAIEKLRTEYDEIIAEGYASNPEPPPKPPGQRGRQARGKALNLLDRFANRPTEVLAFLYEGAPFDNNHAERDLRMMKTRQKISGCFKSEEVLTAFVETRSVLATAKKHAVGAFKVFKTLFGANPTLDTIINPE